MWRRKRRGYHEADLRLCFCICKKSSHDEAHIEGGGIIFSRQNNKDTDQTEGLHS